MILVYHFILSTNEIFVVSYGTGYQSTYLATNNLKVPFFLPTVWCFFLQLAAEKKTPFFVQLKQIFGPSYFVRALASFRIYLVTVLRDLVTF